LLDYSNHELTQEQLENITNYFTKWNNQILIYNKFKVKP
jgi:hypothetical protein